MQIREKSRFFTEVRFYSLSNFLMVFRTLTSVNEAQGNENAGRAKNTSWKYFEKCDSERVQFHSNTAPGNENKRRASLKKRLNKCVQKISNDGFTAPGNENKGFEFEKRAKSTQNIELSSKYRVQNGVKRSSASKVRGVKKVLKCCTGCPKQAFWRFS